MGKYTEKIIKDHNEEVDEKLLEYVLEIFKSGDDIGISLIQRKCRSGYFSASRVLDKLIKEGKVKAGKTPSAICKFL